MVSHVLEGGKTARERRHGLLIPWPYAIRYTNTLKILATLFQSRYFVGNSPTAPSFIPGSGYAPSLAAHMYAAKSSTTSSMGSTDVFPTTSRMSADLADPGSRRVKLTAACESCRKRKARCSGSIPCTFCEKNSFRCVINYDRQRRGPRPKEQASIIPLTNAPRPEMSGRRDSALRESVDGSETQGCQGADEHDADFSEAETILWQNAVDEIVDEDGKSPGLICHLIHVFLTHAHNQHLWILNPATFRDRLIKKLCSQALLYSICAMSWKFSRHPSATSHSAQAIKDQFVKTARCEIVFAPNHSTMVDRIQCLSVLAAYETGEANGKQAWLDISAANSLIQVAMASKLLTPNDSEAVHLVRRYLLVLEREVCLGHTLAPLSSVVEKCKVASPEHVEQSSNSSHLPEMLDLYISIHRFTTKSGVDQDSLPWSVDSEFMNYRQALDRYLILHANEFQVRPENLDPYAEGEDLRIQIENIHCSLAWHCSVIILNRMYLPMPVPSGNGHASTSAGELLGKAYLNTSSAPEPFLKERREACELSASVISEICKNALDCEMFLLPMFMGYCCFHSSVVLINRLRCTQSSDANVVEELKINFTILGAMRKFYESAHEWVEVLFDLHQHSGTQREGQDSLLSDDMLQLYFTCFADIEEPPFVPLDPPRRLQNVLGADASGSGSAIGYTNGARAEPSAANINAHAIWLTQYRSSLQSHILDLEDSHSRTNDQDAIITTADLSDQPPDNVLPITPLREPLLQSLSSQIYSNLNPMSAPVAAVEPPIPPHSRSLDMASMTSYHEQDTGMRAEELSYFSQMEDSGNNDAAQLATQMSSCYRYPQTSDLNFMALLEQGDKMFPDLPYPPHLNNSDWLQQTSTTNGT